MAAHVVMASPEFYEVRDVKNEFMRESVGTVDRALAFEQWEALRRTFERCGVRTQIMAALPPCEDMVFTANANFNGRRKSGERVCVPGRMAFASRRPEAAAHRAWFAAHGYTIVELPGEVERFEGGGDAVWHPGRAAIWAGAGQRTDMRAHRALESIFEVPVMTLELSDPRFYHLDTCFCALSERAVLVYRNAFSADGFALILREFADVIEVEEREATQYFACNAAAFHQNTVVIQAGADRTIQQLQRRGFTVHEVETGEFLKSGGSVFCMKAELY